MRKHMTYGTTRHIPPDRKYTVQEDWHLEILTKTVSDVYKNRLFILSEKTVFMEVRYYDKAYILFNNVFMLACPCLSSSATLFITCNGKRSEERRVGRE